MLRICAVAAAVAAIVLCPSSQAADTATPKLDKAKLEAFIRYNEGFTPIVKMTIDDPTPSSFNGFSRVSVHLSMGPQKIDKVYFVAPDGQQIVNGTLWNLNASPFLDTLENLPANGPAFGPANAKVTIVMFSDFQCPYCREFAKTVRDNVARKYPNDVRVVFQDFPIVSIHKWALAAAEASHCLGDDNPAAFWAFHDWVFDHQGEVNLENVKQKTLDIAKAQNVDLGKVGACIDTHATAAEVQANLRAGEGLGIQQTPTIFINGRQVGGALKWEMLDPILQLELNRSKDIPGPDITKRR